MNKPENENLINLVLDVRNGVEGSFDKLYKETIRFSYNIASFLLKNDEDIEDALQNSYMYVSKYIKDLKKPESFESWLAVIVKHECQKYIASHKRFTDIFSAVIKEESFEVDEEPEMPDNLFENSEKRLAVQKIVDSLPTDKRACVVLYYFEQHSIPEIAEILGVPEGTVKSRLFNARKILEKEFNKLKKNDETFYGISVIPLLVAFFTWSSNNVAVPIAVSEGVSSGIAAGLTGVAATGAATAVGAAVSVGTAVTSTATTGSAVATGISAAAGSASVGSVSAGIVSAKVAAVVVAASVATGGGVATINYLNHQNEITTAPQSLTEEYTSVLPEVHYELTETVCETTAKPKVSVTEPTRRTEKTTAAVSKTESSATSKPSTTAKVTTTKATAPVTITVTAKPETTKQPTSAATLPVTTLPTAQTQPLADDIYSISNGVISEYKGEGGNVSVPSSVGSQSVTAIGVSAFSENEKLTGVSLPSGVTRIGLEAFADCSNLKSVVLPSTLRSIGVGAFYGCTSLTSVNIPSTVTSIGDDAFADCTSLTTVTVPSGVTDIGDNAFGGCDNLTIRCTEGSAAYDYAVENSISFELM